MLYHVYRYAFGVWTSEGSALDSRTARLQAHTLKATNPADRYGYDNASGYLVEVNDET